MLVEWVFRSVRIQEDGGYLRLVDIFSNESIGAFASGVVRIYTVEHSGFNYFSDETYKSTIS